MVVVALLSIHSGQIQSSPVWSIQVQSTE